MNIDTESRIHPKKGVSRRGAWSLALGLWIAICPLLTSGCLSHTPDKRVLQYLNKQGFGRRYHGSSEEEDYLTIGDRVQYVGTYNEEVRGVQEVAIDGTIQMPEAGAVFVAGLTRSEVESYLTQKLAPYYLQTDIKVQIVRGRGKVYYVVGQVARPGARPYTGDITVFDAVMAADPTQFQANLGRVKLIRADPLDPLIIPVNVSEMWESGDSTSNVHVREFDIIYVPPTLLQQTADFVAGIVVPFTSVFNSIIRVLFQLDTGRPIGGQGGRNSRFFF